MMPARRIVPPRMLHGSLSSLDCTGSLVLFREGDLHPGYGCCWSRPELPDGRSWLLNRTTISMYLGNFMLNTSGESASPARPGVLTKVAQKLERR